MITIELDQEAAERLANDVSCAVRDHYTRRELSIGSAYEAINALASVVAAIIVGAREAGFESQAAAFFGMVLTSHLNEYMDRKGTLQ